MNLLRILLALALMLPGLPAWPCASGTASSAQSGNHPGAHQGAQRAAEDPERSGSHHGHAQSMPSASSFSDSSPNDASGKVLHDCCAANDPSSSCSANLGCWQGPGASLITVAANTLAVPAVKGHNMDRLIAALLPSHSLPPFRPPSA